jgi:fatty acid desaturase
MGKHITVTLHGKCVDLSHWANSHPGGRAILEAFNGRDATEQFEAMHSDDARSMLTSTFLPKAAASTFSIGSSKVSEDFMHLRKQLEEKGLFKANLLKETLMAVYTISITFVGAYIACFTQYTWAGLVMFMLGLFQAGWVSHDYLHHSVLPSVYWNEVIGDFLGVMQGYDKGWWKARHNLHHVTTNEVHNDPDIAIAPLLHFVQQYPDLKATLKHIQKYQHMYYIPILTLLDIDWRVESILHIWRNLHKDKWPVVKLSAHYLCIAYMTYVVGSFPILAVFLVRGLMTSLIVFSNHYTEQRYFDTPMTSLVEQTAYTTRNISGGPIVNILSGHISMQIEHHLFPTMPPHNLPKASPYVRQFFAEHNLPYKESTIYECVMRLLRSLNMNTVRTRHA